MIKKIAQGANNRAQRKLKPKSKMPLPDLQENETLSVKIASVVNAKRTINTKAGTRHKFIITFVGCDTTYEYLSPGEIQDEFIPGITRWIKAGFPDPRGQIVFPCEPPRDTRKEVPYMPGSGTAQPAQNTQQTRPAPTYPEQARPTASISLNGQSINFCWAYAKDVVCSMIEAKILDDYTEEAIVEKIANMGNMLNDLMIAKVNNQ